ncbi:MAG: GGDEF domain-containing protein [Clostridia bacterium]|nr:GGDEF domain-containing protein [Clostridia bacterium]
MSAENENLKTHRPVIGVMTGSFHTDYSRLITEAICNRLRKENMDVCLFQGLDASRFLNIDGYVDKGFDSHYYSQYEYSRFIQPDLIIASFGTISAVPNPMSAEDFRSILPDVPVIALEIEADIPNGIHIMLDNYGGMRDCVEHLITEHGCRKIFFVSGPKGVTDAELRLSAYRDTMGRYGLEVTEDMVVYGDFTDHVDPLIEKILAVCPTPDAIVCGNDEMAESAYRVLRAHGLRPGADVAVTGFDDNTAAGLMNPPLTSVRQSKDKIADTVMEIVHAFLRGDKPDSVTLPAQLVLRESCGCPPGITPKVPAQDIRMPNQAMKDRQIIKRLSNESILTSLMLRNLLDQHITVHAFFRRLGSILHLLGAEYSWIALLNEPMAVPLEGRMRLPDHMRLHMLQNQDKVQFWSRKDAPVLRTDDPDLIESLRTPLCGDRQTAVFPLFYGNIHYGFFAVKVSLDEMIFFYTISLQIGTGLRYLYMALDEQETRTALVEKNQILDFSASHDALTGLYNRVGVANQIYDYVKMNGKDQYYVAVMADLDHLKQINDTFGHNMGDHAIRKAAEILRASLPKKTPLGRSGGDEFMALFRADGEDAPEYFYQRVKKTCGDYNARGEIPFYIEISVGCHIFQLQKSGEIPDMFMKADEQLYLDKRNRRKNVIRNSF